MEKVKIESIGDFVEILSGLRTLLAEEGNDKIAFFRGQKNSGWEEIYPSVFRAPYLMAENELYYNLSMKCPEAIPANFSIIDKLVLMQHYGLPTRLLDVTTNPLVALFFACQKNIERIPASENCEMSDEGCFREIETDGEILVLRDYRPQQTGFDVANLIAILAEFNFEFTLEEFKKSIELRGLGEHSVAKLVEMMQQSLPIYTRMNNERIKRQAGAFVICGTQLDWHEGIPADSIMVKKAANLRFRFEQDAGVRYIVPWNKKAEIIDELDFMGINEAFLFPEAEYQSKYIREHQTNSYRSARGFNTAVSTGGTGPSQNDGQDDKVGSVSEEKFAQFLRDVEANLNQVLNDLDDKDTIIAGICVILQSNLDVDWISRESSKAKLSVSIKRLFQSKISLDKQTIINETEKVMSIIEAEYKKHATVPEVTADV